LFEACRRSKVLPRLSWPRWTPRARQLLKLMLPALLGASVVQINLLIDVILASTLPTGSVSFLYYADRVNQLPLGIIGVAIGAVLLPKLSRNIQSGSFKEALTSQEKALEIGMILTLPAAVGLMVLSDPIISSLFQRGLFDSDSASLTALALVSYSAGLPAFVIIKILQPNFFARQDTVTPVKIAAVAVVINLILNLILMQNFAHVGLAMATSISAWISALLLVIALKKKEFYIISTRIWSRLLRITLSACVMGSGLFALTAFSGYVFQTSSILNIVILTLLILSGLIIYFLSLFLFNVLKKDTILKSLKYWSSSN
jgi:putative peptidoglycan lipid II flippase